MQLKLAIALVLDVDIRLRPGYRRPAVDCHVYRDQKDEHTAEYAETKSRTKRCSNMNVSQSIIFNTPLFFWRII